MRLAQQLFGKGQPSDEDKAKYTEQMTVLHKEGKLRDFSTDWDKLNVTQFLQFYQRSFPNKGPNITALHAALAKITWELNGKEYEIQVKRNKDTDDALGYLGAGVNVWLSKGMDLQYIKELLMTFGNTLKESMLPYLYVVPDDALGYLGAGVKVWLSKGMDLQDIKELLVTFGNTLEESMLHYS